MSPKRSSNSIPVYATEAVRALAFLFRPYNDIDIYIEDTTCRNMYEIFVNRILGGRATVRQIFQLGGREEVVSACRKDQTRSDRKRLYIIDGDFDALFGRQYAPGLKYLYQLVVYSSENLIFCETAVIEVACECKTNLPRQNIVTIVDYETFVSEVTASLKDLLVLYAVVYDLGSSLKTMGINVSQLLEQTGKYTKISSTRVSQRIAYLKSELSKNYSEKELQGTIVRIKKLIPTDSNYICRFISGKSYLMPLLHFYLRGKVGLHSTLDELRARLARHCNLNIDPGLAVAIKKTARSR